MPLELLLTAALTCVLAAYLTYRFSQPSSLFYALDVPNARSLHNAPTPRTGGIAIVVSFVLGATAVVALADSDAVALISPLTALLLVAVVGYLDDRFSIAPLPRLGVHCIAAALVVFGGYDINTIDLPGTTLILHPAVAALISALFIVWMINLYNFMDGMDGLAGGMAVVGFGTLSILGYLGNDTLFFGLNLIVAAASAGFLIFNLPRARIFMGDAGAYSLGLIAAISTLWGIERKSFSPIVAFVIFAPFIFDATITLAMRALQRKSLWQAHRDHIYQRLALSGLLKSRVLAIEICLVISCAVSGLIVNSRSTATQMFTLASIGAAYVIIAAYCNSDKLAHPPAPSKTSS